MQTTRNTDPIDHAIALVLVLFEGICWVINEIAGHHVNTAPAPQVTAPQPQTTAPAQAPQTTAQAPAPQPAPHINPLFLSADLTVRQLRGLTGITSRRYRKADLIAAAFAC